MPKVVNNKWAPISSAHSIVMNNEGGTTLKIPMGFYKIQMFCTMLQGGHSTNLNPRKYHRRPWRGYHRHPRSPGQNTCSRDSLSFQGFWGQIQTRAGFIWGLEVSQLLQRIRLGQVTWDLSEIKWALGKVQEPYFPGFPQTLKTGSELKRTPSENQNISVSIKEIPKLSWGLKCLLIVPML